MKCPYCSKENSNSATKCACGYQFSGYSEPVSAGKNTTDHQPIKSPSKISLSYGNKYVMNCSLSFGQILGNMILWTLLTIVTLGLALPFYIFYMCKLLINSIEIYKLSEN